MEEAANIVLDDQSTKLQETRKEQEATRVKANGNGESASSQPTPAPEPQPQPAPAPEQPQGNSGGISDAERDAMIQMMMQAGAGVTGEPTGNVPQDNFTQHEITIDTSGVTLH